MRIFCLSTALIFLFLLPLSAGESLVSCGVAFFEDGMEIRGRQKAVDDAVGKALKKWMRHYYKEKIKDSKYKLFENKVIQNSAKYTNCIVVLDEKKSCLGTFEVTVRVEIDSELLISKAPSLVSTPPKRCVVVMMHSQIKKEYTSVAKKTLALLSLKLQEAGFKVFKQKEKFIAGNQRDMLACVLNLSHNVKTSDYQGLELSSHDIRLSIDMLRLKNKELLGSISFVKSIPDENGFKAFDRGANLCMDALWKELERKLLACN